MAFNSTPTLPFHFYLLIIISTLFCFLLSPSPVFSLSTRQHPSDPSRGVLFEEKGVLFEEKVRLGSTPPSCFNKCNLCHPCTAVQVPSFPSLHRMQLLKRLERSRRTANSASLFVYDKSSWDKDRYSNYKPLGWRCRCKDHFYNP